MPKLKYKSINIPYLCSSPILLLSEIENEGSDKFSISVSTDEYSHVIVEGKVFRLHSGTAKGEIGQLPSGISDVSFVKGTQRITATPILNNKGTIERVPLDSSVLKLIENLLVSLAESIAAAKERILALEEKITPKNMFNFT